MTFAMPKSRMVGTSVPSIRCTITLFGFRSRWMTPQRMGMIERAGQSAADVAHVREGVAAPGHGEVDHVVEHRDALDELHGEIAAACVGPGCDRARDVRMIELGHHLHLALEALDHVGMIGELVVEDLDRDRPAVRRIDARPDRGERA